MSSARAPIVATRESSKRLQGNPTFKPRETIVHDQEDDSVISSSASTFNSPLSIKTTPTSTSKQGDLNTTASATNVKDGMPCSTKYKKSTSGFILPAKLFPDPKPLIESAYSLEDLIQSKTSADKYFHPPASKLLHESVSHEIEFVSDVCQKCPATNFGSGQSSSSIIYNDSSPLHIKPTASVLSSNTDVVKNNDDEEEAIACHSPSTLTEIDTMDIPTSSSPTISGDIYTHGRFSSSAPKVPNSRKETIRQMHATLPDKHEQQIVSFFTRANAGINRPLLMLGLSSTLADIPFHTYDGTTEIGYYLMLTKHPFCILLASSTHGAITLKQKIATYFKEKHSLYFSMSAQNNIVFAREYNIDSSQLVKMLYDLGLTASTYIFSKNSALSMSTFENIKPALLLDDESSSLTLSFVIQSKHIQLVRGMMKPSKATDFTVDVTRMLHFLGNVNGNNYGRVVIKSTDKSSNLQEITITPVLSTVITAIIDRNVGRKHFH